MLASSPVAVAIGHSMLVIATSVMAMTGLDIYVGLSH